MNFRGKGSYYLHVETFYFSWHGMARQGKGKKTVTATARGEQQWLSILKLERTESKECSVA